MNKMDLMGYVKFKTVIESPVGKWVKCTFNLSRRIGKPPHHKYENIPCICWDKGVFDKINDGDFITLTSYLPTATEYMDGDKKRVFWQLRIYELEQGVYKSAINTPIVEKKAMDDFNLDSAFEIAESMEFTPQVENEPFKGLENVKVANQDLDEIFSINPEQEWENWGKDSGLGVDKETFIKQMEKVVENKNKAVQKIKDNNILENQDINLNNDYLNELNSRLSPANPEERIIDATPTTKKEY